MPHAMLKRLFGNGKGKGGTAVAVCIGDCYRIGTALPDTGKELEALLQPAAAGLSSPSGHRQGSLGSHQSARGLKGLLQHLGGVSGSRGDPSQRPHASQELQAQQLISEFLKQQLGFSEVSFLPCQEDGQPPRYDRVLTKLTKLFKSSSAPLVLVLYCGPSDERGNWMLAGSPQSAVHSSDSHASAALSPSAAGPSAGWSASQITGSPSSGPTGLLAQAAAAPGGSAPSQSLAAPCVVLSFREVSMLWQRHRKHSQRLVLLCDCANSGYWASGLRGLSKAEQLELSLGVQASDCSSPYIQEQQLCYQPGIFTHLFMLANKWRRAPGRAGVPASWPHPEPQEQQAGGAAVAPGGADAGAGLRGPGSGRSPGDTWLPGMFPTYFCTWLNDNCVDYGIPLRFFNAVLPGQPAAGLCSGSGAVSSAGTGSVTAGSAEPLFFTSGHGNAASASQLPAAATGSRSVPYGEPGGRVLDGGREAAPAHGAAVGGSAVALLPSAADVDAGQQPAAVHNAGGDAAWVDRPSVDRTSDTDAQLHQMRAPSLPDGARRRYSSIVDYATVGMGGPNRASSAAAPQVPGPAARGGAGGAQRSPGAAAGAGPGAAGGGGAAAADGGEGERGSTARVWDVKSVLDGVAEADPLSVQHSARSDTCAVNWDRRASHAVEREREMAVLAGADGGRTSGGSAGGAAGELRMPGEASGPLHAQDALLDSGSASMSGGFAGQLLGALTEVATEQRLWARRTPLEGDEDMDAAMEDTDYNRCVSNVSLPSFMLPHGAVAPSPSGPVKDSGSIMLTRAQASPSLAGGVPGLHLSTPRTSMLGAAPAAGGGGRPGAVSTPSRLFMTSTADLHTEAAALLEANMSMGLLDSVQGPMPPISPELQSASASVSGEEPHRRPLPGGAASTSSGPTPVGRTTDEDGEAVIPALDAAALALLAAAGGGALPPVQTRVHGHRVASGTGEGSDRGTGSPVALPGGLQQPVPSDSPLMSPSLSVLERRRQGRRGSGAGSDPRERNSLVLSRDSPSASTSMLRQLLKQHVNIADSCDLDSATASPLIWQRRGPGRWEVGGSESSSFLFGDDQDRYDLLKELRHHGIDVVDDGRGLVSGDGAEGSEGRYLDEVYVQEGDVPGEPVVGQKVWPAAAGLVPGAATGEGERAAGGEGGDGGAGAPAAAQEGVARVRGEQVSGEGTQVVMM